jgi:serine/threonine protein kinase
MSKFEERIMQILNSKDTNDQYHIVRFYESFDFNGHFCIVMELLQKTLLQLLDLNNSEGISLKSIKFISKQILQSIEFIHRQGIVHTDLKPENILFSVFKEDKTGNNTNISLNTTLTNKRVSIKIADFGTACTKTRLSTKNQIQSLFYRAPEVILEMPKKNEKIDIWSIGCILAELYLGTPLLPGNSSFDQLSKICQLIGECPQYMIEKSPKKDEYFKRDNMTFNHIIKNYDEYYKENPDVEPKKYDIPKNLKNIDDIINVKKDLIKSKSSFYKSMHNSSLSLNSSYTKDDTVAFIHFIKMILQIDPEKRWSCKQCLKHPFLTNEKFNEFILNEIFTSENAGPESYNYQRINYFSMNNNSFNTSQCPRGFSNKNNTFYMGNSNKGFHNNYNFFNFNKHNNAHNLDQSIIQNENQIKFNKQYPQNQNYSFSFNPNYQFCNQFNGMYNPPMYGQYNNNNNIFPPQNYFYQNNYINQNNCFSNNYYNKHNNTFVGSSNLNNSFNNSFKNKNEKKNQFYKNKNNKK